MLIDDNLDTSTAVTGRPLPCWWDVEGGEGRVPNLKSAGGVARRKAEWCSSGLASYRRCSYGIVLAKLADGVINKTQVPSSLKLSTVNNILRNTLF